MPEVTPRILRGWLSGRDMLFGGGADRLPNSEYAESIQEDLASFARIARLRAVLSAEGLRAWLHLPNDLLDGHSPRAVIRGGGVETVAELAEDMLSGSPA